MRTIHKCPIALVEGSTRLFVHRGAKIVLVDHQIGIPAIWLEVETDQPREEREFIVVGTGHKIPSEYAHIGSFKSDPYVWHIYEKG